MLYMVNNNGLVYRLSVKNDLSQQTKDCAEVSNTELHAGFILVLR